MVLSSSYGIIGYDCSHPMANFSRISSLDVGECDLKPIVEESTDEFIYLIQRADVLPIHVYQCKLSVIQIINYCGMHSHSSIVQGGISTIC